MVAFFSVLLPRAAQGGVGLLDEASSVVLVDRAMVKGPLVGGWAQ